MAGVCSQDLARAHNIPPASDRSYASCAVSQWGIEPYVAPGTPWSRPWAWLSAGLIARRSDAVGCRAPSKEHAAATARASRPLAVRVRIEVVNVSGPCGHRGPGTHLGADFAPVMGNKQAPTLPSASSHTSPAELRQVVASLDAWCNDSQLTLLERSSRLGFWRLGSRRS